ncbi:MAG: type II toxin-antitoxin system VapC family toxin [Xenococcaceae cyanobacterium MO_167.B27]|nr:type II toxin-antitoxin system VapC family toxin [Xenococcaceae cyanobacterium MO_167.B27]
MSYLYLLDTNILSELIKHPRGIIFYKIKQIGEEKICTSIIVAGELRFGIKNKNSPRLVEKLKIVLDAIDILPFTSPADLYYAEIRHNLKTRGTPIGANDLLIAAHALSLNLTLVTANVSEFSRVSNLKVENWLEQD